MTRSCDLEGKKAVVIGGGKVAYRKINSLVEAGATVTVASFEINDV
ncbi:NAD(P)-dependent oxidoreductase [Pseudalkalibacillus sp. A8]